MYTCYHNVWQTVKYEKVLLKNAQSNLIIFLRGQDLTHCVYKSFFDPVNGHEPSLFETTVNTLIVPLKVLSRADSSS